MDDGPRVTLPPGRLSTAAQVQPAPGAYDESTFIIYPNPVKDWHARVTTNCARTCRFRFSIWKREETRRSFDVNPNGLANTPFDEAIDVHALKSGVYLLRLRIESSAGSGSLVKTFAIRR
jgi:hypothetical protein